MNKFVNVIERMMFAAVVFVSAFVTFLAVYAAIRALIGREMSESELDAITATLPALIALTLFIGSVYIITIAIQAITNKRRQRRP